MQLNFLQLEYGSPLHDESVQLRNEVLRKPLGLEFTVSQMLDELNQLHLGVLNENHELVACLLLKELSTELVKMRQVAVLPHLQGKGIGSTLVGYAEYIALFKGYHNMELNARKSAVSFYLNLDYHIIGDEFLEVNIPHFKMSKSLIYKNVD